MHWLWVLIVGGLIGLAAGAITHRGGAMGVIANIIAGLVGSSIGEAILGSWGPQVAGMAIIPSVIGAVILVLVISLIFGVKRMDWQYLNRQKQGVWIQASCFFMKYYWWRRWYRLITTVSEILRTVSSAPRYKYGGR